MAIGVNVALGAVLGALLLWLNRGDETHLAGEADARRLFADKYTAAVSAVVLCDAGRSALLSLDRGMRMGLIDRHARRWNIRMFSAAELRRVDLDERGGIHIRFIDFGWPSARLTIRDSSLRAHWYRQLKDLGADEALRPGVHSKDPRHA